MINLLKKLNTEPYLKFYDLYNEALNAGQKNVEAICISSYDPTKNEVSSRYVNLKYISENNWIFFSNYKSRKAEDFSKHDQVSGTIFWDKINVQIRLKANIKKTSIKTSDSHFMNRDIYKNALAISSSQSGIIKSFNEVKKNYEKILKKILKENPSRPEYWGGYEFTPYQFEFWKGNKYRLNERTEYILDGDKWDKFFLQP